MQRLKLIFVIKILLILFLLFVPANEAYGYDPTIGDWPSVHSIVFSPNFATDNTLYSAVKWEGIYKSTDGGANWVKAFTWGYDQLAISPNFANDKTILTGGPGGLLISVNEGKSWRKVDNGSVSKIVFSPNYIIDKTLFAVTNNGIYISKNGINNWQRILEIRTEYFMTELVVSPGFAVDNTIFASDWFYLYTNCYFS